MGKKKADPKAHFYESELVVWGEKILNAPKNCQAPGKLYAISHLREPHVPATSPASLGPNRGKRGSFLVRQCRSPAEPGEPPSARRPKTNETRPETDPDQSRPLPAAG